MLGQGQHRLQHVQAVDAGRVQLRQRLAEEVGLLLVVPFEANAVAAFEHRVQQVGDARGRQRLALHLAAQRRARAVQPFGAIDLQRVPHAGRIHII